MVIQNSDYDAFITEATAAELTRCSGIRGLPDCWRRGKSETRLRARLSPPQGWLHFLTNFCDFWQRGRDLKAGVTMATQRYARFDSAGRTGPRRYPPGPASRLVRPGEHIVEDGQVLAGLLQYAQNAVDSGLTRLETANNWTLTVALGLVVVVVSSGSFPSQKSLLLLSAAIPLVSHFIVRAMKGYINVVRYSVVSRSVADVMLGSDDPVKASSALQGKFRVYVAEWALPVKRYQVWVKALTEFSFGYIIAGLVGLAVYNIACIRHVSGPVGVVCLLLIATAIAELARFNFHSPYMRVVRADDDAVRLR